MKSNSRSCGLFSYDTYEGMRAFCIIEMFLAPFHLIVALSRIPVVERWCAGWYKVEGDDDSYLVQEFWAAFTLFFMITLIAQSVLAFVLYFIGWKKKHWVVCIVWAVFAGTNALWPWIFLIFYLTDSEGTGAGWDYYLLYLLYPIYGIWIVVDFMIGEIGRPTPRGRVNPSSSPSSAKPDSSKKPNTKV